MITVPEESALFMADMARITSLSLPSSSTPTTVKVSPLMTISCPMGFSLGNRAARISPSTRQTRL